MDLDLAVRLSVKDAQRFKSEVRGASEELRRLGRDSQGRFVGRGGAGGLPPGVRMGRDGRLRDAGGRFVGGGGGSGGADGGRDNVGRRMRDVGSDFQAAGAKIVVAGAATAYGLKRLIQPVEDYERAIVDTISVTGDAASNLGNEQKLRKLSESFVGLGANATDTARAMEFLALAGYSTQQQMQAMPNVMFAARAGSEDVIKTAGYLSDVATGFGFGADKFQRVSDVMTYVNNATSTTLSATAEAMKEIGPYAQQAGLDFENMAAGIGVLANAGFRGRQAGTAMRNMLLSFTKMSDPARAELKKLGLEQQDFIEMINKGDLQGAVLKLDEAVQKKNYGAGDKFRVMNTIFQRFTSAKEMGLALSAVRGGKWDELTAGAKRSKGSAEEVAKRKLDSDAGRMDVARARYEQMQVKIGQKILPALLPVGESLVGILEDVARWVDKHQDLAAGIAKWMAIGAASSAVVGPAVTIFGTFTRGIGLFTSMVTKAAPATAALTDAVAGGGGLGGAAAGAGGKVGKLNMLLGSAGLVASAAAAGVAVGTLADQWLGLSDKLAGVRSGTDDNVDAPWWERVFSNGTKNFSEDYKGSGGKLASRRGAPVLTDEENSKRWEIEQAIKDKEAEAAAIRQKYDGSFSFSDESAAAYARAKQLTSEANALKTSKETLINKAQQRTLDESANKEKYREKFVQRAEELKGMRDDVQGKYEAAWSTKNKKLKRRRLHEAWKAESQLETEELLTARKASRLGMGLEGGKAFENKGAGWREALGIDLKVTVEDGAVKKVEAKTANKNVNVDAGDFWTS